MFSKVKGSSYGFCSKCKISFLNLFTHCHIDRKSDWVPAMFEKHRFTFPNGSPFCYINFYIQLLFIKDCPNWADKDSTCFDSPSSAKYACLHSLREKCTNTEFFLFRIFLCSDWIQENRDQKKNYLFGHFSCSGCSKIVLKSSVLFPAIILGWYTEWCH